MTPSEGFKLRESNFNKVDLPHPFGPIIEVIALELNVNDKSFIN